jgi:hypothetical protein
VSKPTGVCAGTSRRPWGGRRLPAMFAGGTRFSRMNRPDCAGHRKASGRNLGPQRIREYIYVRRRLPVGRNMRLSCRPRPSGCDPDLQSNLASHACFGSIAPFHAHHEHGSFAPTTGPGCAGRKVGVISLWTIGEVSNLIQIFLI